MDQEKEDEQKTCSRRRRPTPSGCRKEKAMAYLRALNELMGTCASTEARRALQRSPRWTGATTRPDLP